MRFSARLALPLLVAGVVGFSAAGCGSSSEKKDDPRSEPITRPAEDPPRTDTKAPPLGRPRSKVAPSGDAHAHDMKASDSLYRDETPH